MTTARTSSPATRRPRGEGVSNRSLERGIRILRAFSPGVESLGNGDLAERTGLPRATVSRLMHTLVLSGYLEYDAAGRSYRLAAPVLSLGHAMKTASPVLRLAGPWMRDLAQSRRINVGIAVPDGDEMVYLESIRYSRRMSLRNVVAGQRVPVELTSLGRAWLATLAAGRRAAWVAAMRRRRPAHAKELAREIAAAVRHVGAHGYCAAAWQPGVVALSTPLSVPGAPHILNVSVANAPSIDQVAAALSEDLLALAGRIEAALAQVEAGP